MKLVHIYGSDRLLSSEKVGLHPFSAIMENQLTAFSWVSRVRLPIPRLLELVNSSSSGREREREEEDGLREGGRRERYGLHLIPSSLDRVIVKYFFEKKSVPAPPNLHRPIRNFRLAEEIAPQIPAASHGAREIERRLES